MKTLATIIAVAAAVPFAALAQTPPPPPLLDLAPEPAAAVVTTSAEPESPLNLGAYPSAQRDAIWARYARKSQISVNILYPLGGLVMTTVVSGFVQSFGDSAMGAFSLPVEYERSVNRNLSLFGVVQPTFAMGRGQSAFSVACGAGVRGYFSGNAPQGVWTGVEADTVAGSQAVTMRWEVGVNALYDNNLTVSFGGGLGVTYAADVLNPFTGMNIPFFPAAGLRFSIGYAL